MFSYLHFYQIVLFHHIETSFTNDSKQKVINEIKIGFNVPTKQSKTETT